MDCKFNLGTLFESISSPRSYSTRYSAVNRDTNTQSMQSECQQNKVIMVGHIHLELFSGKSIYKHLGGSVRGYRLNLKFSKTLYFLNQIGFDKEHFIELVNST